MTPHACLKSSRMKRQPFSAAERPIRNEDGVWVFRSGQKVDVSIRELIEEGRDERHRSILCRGD